jgi:hypothetical protein
MFAGGKWTATVTTWQLLLFTALAAGAVSTLIWLLFYLKSGA